MKKETDSYRLFLLVLYGTVLLCLMTAAVVIQKDGAVIWINSHHTPFLDGFFRMVTHLGDGLIFLPFIVALLFVRFHLAIIAAVSWAGHGLFSFILKRWIFPDALRPKALLDNDLLYFIPGVQVHEQHSFPSGHAATIFCLALLVSLCFNSRRLTLIALVVALTVGYSRIYLLQHFPGDVAAGAVLGVLTTLLFWTVFKGAGDLPWMNRRLPWPQGKA